MRPSVEEIQRDDERWRVEQEQNSQRWGMEGSKGGEKRESGFRISKKSYCQIVNPQTCLGEVLEKIKGDKKSILWELSDYYSIMKNRKINIKSSFCLFSQDGVDKILLIVLPLLDVFLVSLDGWSIVMGGGLVNYCCFYVRWKRF